MTRNPRTNKLERYIVATTWIGYVEPVGSFRTVAQANGFGYRRFRNRCGAFSIYDRQTGKQVDPRMHGLVRKYGAAEAKRIQANHLAGVIGY